MSTVHRVACRRWSQESGVCLSTWVHLTLTLTFPSFSFRVLCLALIRSTAGVRVHRPAVREGLLRGFPGGWQLRLRRECCAHTGSHAAPDLVPDRRPDFQPLRGPNTGPAARASGSGRDVFADGGALLVFIAERTDPKQQPQGTRRYAYNNNNANNNDDSAGA